VTTENIICPVCNTSNDKEATFCGQCIAPLNVQNLSEQTDSDLAQNSKAFMEVLQQLLSIKLDASQIPTEKDKAKNHLQAFLSAFWLRPDTALLQATESWIVNKLMSKDAGPFMDLGCGDGIMTSLLRGWRFGSEFDAYSGLQIKAKDLFNSPPPEKFRSDILTRGNTIEYGLDIRANMIQRAQLLGTFEEVVEANATSIPQKDGSLGIIYSNVLRDFEGDTLSKILLECSRLLKDGGQLIFSSPTEHYKDFLYFYPRYQQAKKDRRTEDAQISQKLDRGRSEYCVQQITIDQWSEHLNKVGLKINSYQDFGNKNFTNFWDTGIRPYVPGLLKFLSNIDFELKYLLKKQAVSLAVDLLEPVFLENISGVTKSAFRIISARKIK